MERAGSTISIYASCTHWHATAHLGHQGVIWEILKRRNSQACNSSEYPIINPLNLSENKVKVDMRYKMFVSSFAYYPSQGINNKQQLTWAYKLITIQPLVLSLTVLPSQTAVERNYIFDKFKVIGLNEDPGLKSTTYCPWQVVLQMLRGCRVLLDYHKDPLIRSYQDIKGGLSSWKINDLSSQPEPVQQCSTKLLGHTKSKKNRFLYKTFLRWLYQSMAKLNIGRLVLLFSQTIICSHPCSFRITLLFLNMKRHF